MAAFQKYHLAIEDAFNKQHDFGADTFAIILSNTAPTVATNNTQANASEIAAGNGYTTGGETITITSAVQTAGVLSVVPAADVVFTATGGSMAPFRYAIFLNVTANKLVSFWDRGSELTLLDNDTLTFDVESSLFTAS